MILQLDRRFFSNKNSLLDVFMGRRQNSEKQYYWQPKKQLAENWDSEGENNEETIDDYSATL